MRERREKKTLWITLYAQVILRLAWQKKNERESMRHSFTWRILFFFSIAVWGFHCVFFFPDTVDFKLLNTQTSACCLLALDSSWRSGLLSQSRSFCSMLYIKLRNRIVFVCQGLSTMSLRWIGFKFSECHQNSIRTLRF